MISHVRHDGAADSSPWKPSREPIWRASSEAPEVARLVLLPDAHLHPGGVPRELRRYDPEHVPVRVAKPLLEAAQLLGLADPEEDFESAWFED